LNPEGIINNIWELSSYYEVHITDTHWLIFGEVISVNSENHANT